MCVIEVYEERFGWGVRPLGGFPLARLPTLEQASRRAQWIAVRMAGSGAEPVIRRARPTASEDKGPLG